MAYNVFKRPMFKRGGSTTGTGIMSHVEPRIKAQRGYGSYSAGFPYEMSQFYPKRAPLNFPADAVAMGAASYPTSQNVSSYVGIQDYMPEVSGDGLMSQYENWEDVPTYIKNMPFAKDMWLARQKEKREKSGIETITPENIKSANVMEEIIKQKKVKEGLDKDIDVDIIEKEKPKYKGTDIKAEVESETKLIKELLKDEGYSKGELALLIAGAVGEPGTISDKLAKARELALPIAKKRKEEDRAITLAAYKLAKEKEREQIKADAKASTGTEYQRNLRDVARATANQPGEERSADEIYDSLLAAKTPGAEVRMKQLEKISPNILEAAKDIANLKVELEKAKTDKDKQRIQGDIDRKLSLLEQVSDFPEFEIAFPGLKERVGLKEGGRVKLAEGTEVEDDIITSNVSFGSGSATTSEPVQQLSYEQLRDRLPPEITDDVVNLLANNAEALQQFAYIRTQEDVNAFNVKYGVNLVIPPTRT